jgi:hypothetical protein
MGPEMKHEPCRRYRFRFNSQCRMIYALTHTDPDRRQCSFRWNGCKSRSNPVSRTILQRPNPLWKWRNLFEDLALVVGAWPTLPAALRHEKGEQGGRPHFHFLIRALPSGANSSHFRMAAMSRWESLGGGMARIRRFDNQEYGGEKDAVCHVVKNLGGNAYELAKFEQDESDSVRLSPALLERLEHRSQKITV